MSDKAINHGFTAEQSAWLAAQFSAARSNAGFDKATIKWMVGGLVAIGIAVAGAIWSEIRENRSAITELAKGQAELAKGLAELAKDLARIEAILNERLPRSE